MIVALVRLVSPSLLFPAGPSDVAFPSITRKRSPNTPRLASNPDPSPKSHGPNMHAHKIFRTVHASFSAPNMFRLGTSPSRFTLCTRHNTGFLANPNRHASCLSFRLFSFTMYALPSHANARNPSWLSREACRMRRPADVSSGRPAYPVVVFLLSIRSPWKSSPSIPTNNS